MAITINQAGLSAGVSDKSRSDGLATGALISITSSVATSLILVWKPDEEAATLTSLDSQHYTLSPTTGIYGSYMFYDPASDTRRIFSVRTPHRNLRIPALNETGHADASLINNSAPYIEASDFNELSGSGPFAAGNYGGWYSAMRELVIAVDNISSSAGNSSEGDPGASYLVLNSTASLSHERVFSVSSSSGLNASDNGTTLSLSVNNNLVATVSGTRFTGAITGTVASFSQLTGSLTKTSTGVSAFVAGSGISIASGSTGQVIFTGQPFTLPSIASSDLTASVQTVQRVNVSGSAVTVSLPASHVSTNQIIIKLVSVTNNVCTVSGSLGATIDNNASITLTTAYEWATLISDGTNWLQIS